MAIGYRPRLYRPTTPARSREEPNGYVAVESAAGVPSAYVLSTEARVTYVIPAQPQGGARPFPPRG